MPIVRQYLATRKAQVESIADRPRLAARVSKLDYRTFRWVVGTERPIERSRLKQAEVLRVELFFAGLIETMISSATITSSGVANNPSISKVCRSTFQFFFRGASC